MDPWTQWPASDPRGDPANWVHPVGPDGTVGTGLAYAGPTPDGGFVTYDATLPPPDYGGGAPAQPAYSTTGGGDYTGYPAPGAPAQPAYDPMSSAYPVSQPTYGTGTPGTGSNMANPYDPSQVTFSDDASLRAIYDAGVASGTVPGSALAPAPATDPYAAPAADPYAGVPYAADPYAAPAASTDPYTGLPVYEPAFSVSEPYSASGGYGGEGYGGGGAAPSFGSGGSTYPYPSFGQSAMNPGRQQPVVPGQFDPFAWSDNPNPMPAPNETRQMILGAMQLGAEIEQQRNQQPTMNATNYALHRLGLNKPDEPTPQMPATSPQRSRFGM